MINFSSPRDIDDLLSKHGLSPRKRFGQNFLVNPGAAAHIVDAASIQTTDVVWEIGPGIGTLTVELERRARKLVAFEIDRGLVALVRELLGDSGKLTIVEGDVIETIGEALGTHGSPDVIVGNLPYNSASAIIMRLFELACIPETMVCTVQREVAQRLLAEPATEHYSSFTVVCRIAWEIERLGDLKAGSFHPRPGVVSTILRFTPSSGPQPSNRRFFLRMCRCLFASRRKTILNNLRVCTDVERLGEEGVIRELDKARIAPSARAESAEPERILDLVESFRKTLLLPNGGDT